MKGAEVAVLLGFLEWLALAKTGTIMSPDAAWTSSAKMLFGRNGLVGLVVKGLFHNE
jgi:hypothetical protein